LPINLLNTKSPPHLNEFIRAGPPERRSRAGPPVSPTNSSGGNDAFGQALSPSRQIGTGSLYALLLQYLFCNPLCRPPTCLIRRKPDRRWHLPHTSLSGSPHSLHRTSLLKGEKARCIFIFGERGLF
jgi:hypothetical protein